MTEPTTTTTTIFHEDIPPGTSLTLGSGRLSKDEIIAFGRLYDPQPMHVDEAAARHTLVGGLCASGFHTCAFMMRLLVESLLDRMASLGSPGVEETRWTKPLRPDITHTAFYTVLASRDLASRPDVGMQKVKVELKDEAGDPVAHWISSQFTRKRTPGVRASQDGGASAPRPKLPEIWSRTATAAGTKPDGYFEEREIGETYDLGAHTFTRDEIIAFARQFDPQPFHLDEAAAAKSLFGGLCASGWHTAAIFIRNVVRARQEANRAALAAGRKLAAYGPSPGFRNLLWLKPVFVNDTISFRASLTEKIDLKSRPNRGIVVNSVQGRNQHGEVVFAITSQILVERLQPFTPPG